MIDNKYHFEGRDKSGKPIVIDIADLNSLSHIDHGAGRYEVMVMRPGGHEIDCETAPTPEQAAKLYAAMVDRYALKDGEDAPLTGKYAKLRDDLRAALSAAEQAAANVEDSGTCNMDACALYLPRWREALVEQAAKEAGTSCGDWTLFGRKQYVFFPRVSGQAYKREIAAEAMTDEMKRRGYDAFTYQAMD